MIRPFSPALSIGTHILVVRRFRATEGVRHFCLGALVRVLDRFPHSHVLDLRAYRYRCVWHHTSGRTRPASTVLYCNKLQRSWNAKSRQDEINVGMGWGTCMRCWVSPEGSVNVNSDGKLRYINVIGHDAIPTGMFGTNWKTHINGRKFWTCHIGVRFQDVAQRGGKDLFQRETEVTLQIKYEN